MSYKALYRVFRPKTFAEVVGQKHIVSVLKSQVMSGQISHAYLFTGSRGTGKTSIAKIFARSISCPDSHEGEACLNCQLCHDTFNDTSMDVVEIDAASNNGVDEIRELRENVKYAPVTGKYRVYIIDEVHMLSAGAFNALLKTLEEPPAHVVFILATTEPQKLPETIISRCQRYDFERIDREEIADRLEYICKETGAVADRDALLMIADFSRGGLRDAISIMDQCIAFGDNKVTGEGVLDLLGKSEDEALFKFGDLLIEKDTAGLISLVGELVKKGQNPTVLTGDMVEHLRKLMLFKTAKNPEQIADTVKIEEYKEQSKKANLPMLLRGIKILSAAMSDMRYSFLPVVVLEVALMDICTPTAGDDNFAILQRLEELEKAVKEGVTVKVAASAVNTAPVTEKPITKKAEEKPIVKTEPAKPVKEDLPWDEAFTGVEAPPEDEGAFIMDELIAEPEPQLQEPVTEPEQDEAPSVPRQAGDFTAKDYDDFLKRMNKANKGVYISLKNSFFGGCENGKLIIAYPDESYGIFMQAAEAKSAEIMKTLNDMGFKDLKVCVKILKQDKTEDLKKLFGDDIKFID